MSGCLVPRMAPGGRSARSWIAGCPRCAVLGSDRQDRRNALVLHKGESLSLSAAPAQSTSRMIGGATARYSSYRHSIEARRHCVRQARGPGRDCRWSSELYQIGDVQLWNNGAVVPVSVIAHGRIQRADRARERSGRRPDGQQPRRPALRPNRRTPHIWQNAP